MGDAFPLLRKALGEDAWRALPEGLRLVHAGQPCCRLSGEVEIDSAANPLARMAAWVFGFPTRTARLAASVEIEADAAGETWMRRFGDHRFRSRLSPASRPGHLHERFGPFRFLVETPPMDQGFGMRVVSWSLLGLPLPPFLAPSSEAREWMDGEGRLRFDVPIRLPLLGPLVHYRGWLRPMLAEAMVTDPATVDSNPALC